MEVWLGHAGRRAQRERRPAGGWTAKKVSVLISGHPGTSRASLCAVAAVPAQHSESLCWALLVPAGKGANTVCLVHKARAPGPQGLAAVRAGTNRPAQSGRRAPRTPCNRNRLLLDFNSELKAHLSLASPWLINNPRDFWGLSTFRQPLLLPLPWTTDGYSECAIQI